jgi:hypothetical protein
VLALNDTVVAVIDDDEDGRDTLIDDLSDHQFRPVPIMGKFGHDIDKLIGEVEALKPGFIICDHRLTAQQFASFTGLEVVERLIEHKFPAMLLTTFQDPERLVLRAAGARVPVIRGRDRFKIEDVPILRNTILREIEQKPVASRRPHRVLLRVEAARASEIDVVVPSWNRDHAFVIPRDQLGMTVRQIVTAGDYLLGNVNIGAKNEEDLFFDEVDEIVEGVADLG